MLNAKNAENCAPAALNAQQIKHVSEKFKALQQTICSALEAAAGATPSDTFQPESWAYEVGEGGGISCAIEGGDVFERAAVNFSHVKGAQLPAASVEAHAGTQAVPFEATGVSLVLHPRNPFAPTAHANVRMITTQTHWWFGGGFDLTPHYLFKADTLHWHTAAKKVCQPEGEGVYTQMKAACDSYFFLPHRNEPRGIGGIFYDEWTQGGFEKCVAFSNRVGEGFIDAFVPILERRKDTAYNATHREHQLHRRGRYVEFNLLYDRGTRFGLQSGGRAESILMSMPPHAKWACGKGLLGQEAGA